MTALAVPRSILIFKKCVKHGIDSNLIGHLHFFDLQCLIIQFETQEVLTYIEKENEARLHKKGIKEIKQIDGNQALKFLGR